MSDPRLRPRRLFVQADRRLEVIFYTSNTDKFLQARTVFRRCGLTLQQFRRSDPYSEDYSGTKELLLSQAIKEIRRSIGGSGALFFVEDTSLRVEAVSSETEDVPGLRVKEWFEETPFAELNDVLQSAGNNRAATVKSDIALNVPGLSEPVMVHGSMTGMIAATPPTFPQHPIYPWLTPATFNGLFVPTGSTKRLGEMEFEESTTYDFRVQSLLSLVDRLEEYSAALNLPPQAYSRRRVTSPATQIGLFEFGPHLFVAIGATCAGKTTFGEYAEQSHGARFIEASDVMRMLGEGYAAEDLAPVELARRVTDAMGADAIALRCLDMASEEQGRPVVITGFRFIEEIEAVRQLVPDARVVVIEASERTRLERALLRGRSGDPASLADMRRKDAEQATFGLLPVAHDVATDRIDNEGGLDDYFRQIDALLTDRRADDPPGVTRDLTPRHSSATSQLFRALDALVSAGRPVTTAELEEITAETGQPIRHNNANKVLKRVPAFARRLDDSSRRIRYEILTGGRAYLRLMSARENDVDPPPEVPPRT